MRPCCDHPLQTVCVVIGMYIISHGICVGHLHTPPRDAGFRDHSSHDTRQTAPGRAGSLSRAAKAESPDGREPDADPRPDPCLLPATHHIVPLDPKPACEQVSNVAHVPAPAKRAGESSAPSVHTPPTQTAECLKQRPTSDDDRRERQPSVPSAGPHLHQECRALNQSDGIR